MIEIELEEREWTGLTLPQSAPGWHGLERVMPAIVERFVAKAEVALEFGVEYGFSTAVLATFFHSVIGVDTFRGDQHCGTKPDHYWVTRKRLEPWPNVVLVPASYQDWIKQPTSSCDLIHVDIVHTYADTHVLTRWAVDHAPVVIAHDTESFAEVKRAVADVAEESGRTFYNYPKFNGLGILV